MQEIARQDSFLDVEERSWHCVAGTTALSYILYQWSKDGKRGTHNVQCDKEAESLLYRG